MRSEGIQYSVGVSVCLSFCHSVCYQDSGSTHAIQVLKHAQMGTKPCFLGFKVARFLRQQLAWQRSDRGTDLHTSVISHAHALLSIVTDLWTFVGYLATPRLSLSHCI